MNRFIFGVKSTAPANTILTNGYTLYDWVMRKNCFPSFWGRSISGVKKPNDEELRFLKEKDCKIALIFDELSEMSVSSTNGVEDAKRAIAALNELGVPANEGYAVFAEIKDNWSVSNIWMLGFSRIIRNYGYVPGFIGNTDSSLNFNFDKEFSHYMLVGEDSLCWATKPETNGPIFEWTPFAPSALKQNDVAVWQKETMSFNDIVFNSVYMRDPTILNYAWDFEGKEE